MKNIAEIRLTIEEMFGNGDKVVTHGNFEWLVVEAKEKKKMMAIVISWFKS